MNRQGIVSVLTPPHAIILSFDLSLTLKQIFFVQCQNNFIRSACYEFCGFLCNLRLAKVIAIVCKRHESGIANERN